MKRSFDPKILKVHSISEQYEKRLSHLEKKDPPLWTKAIKNAVTNSIDKINKSIGSFVIYGEPQSGKTEMMIALAAKLLDEGFKLIIILTTNNVSLLEQSLNRFKITDLSPTPRNFKEVLSEHINIENTPWIIFCKKGPQDLEKLIEKLGLFKKRIIIDDEADFATPNSKINLPDNQKSKINQLIEKLRGEDGIWIGVTATPARLDLNNTLNNDNINWVKFESHPNYTGKDHFFPIEGKIPYKLTLLPDDNQEHLIDAVLNFLIKVAYLNISSKKSNYTMVVHTSGKVDDHTRDYQTIIKLVEILRHKENPKWEIHYENIWNKADKLFNGKADEISKYIIENIGRADIVTMNSKKDIAKANSGTPLTPFTIIIGGNIISRGMTFDNLLSMFFTRNVKGNFNQDTYIQRARMFGSRGSYIDKFELIIPKELYLKWNESFVLYRLSLESILEGNQPPVWLFNARVKPTALGSIDRSTVIMHNGEMKFGIFKLSEDIKKIISSRQESLKKLESLKEVLKNEKQAFPEFLLRYIKKTSEGKEDLIAIHSLMNVSRWRNVKNLYRPKSFMSSTSQKTHKFEKAIHHIQMIYDDTGYARLIYKPTIKKVGFLTNIKNVN